MEYPITSFFKFKENYSYRCRSKYREGGGCDPRIPHEYVDEVEVVGNIARYKLHGNIIAELKRENGLKLSIYHCDWHTALTRDRLNAILYEARDMFGIPEVKVFLMNVFRRKVWDDQYLVIVINDRFYEFRNPVIIDLLSGKVYNDNPEVVLYDYVRVGRKKFNEFGDYMVWRFRVYGMHAFYRVLNVMVRNDGKVFFRFGDKKDWVEVRSYEDIRRVIPDNPRNSEVIAFIKTLLT